MYCLYSKQMLLNISEWPEAPIRAYNELAEQINAERDTLC